MKKLLFLLLLLPGLAQGQTPAPTPSAYALQLEAAIKTNNVVLARQLIAKPEFSPLLTGAEGDGTRGVFETALLDDRPTIANLMFASPQFKSIKWTPKNTSALLVIASGTPIFNPLTKKLALLPGFDLNTPNFPGEVRMISQAASNGNVEMVRFLLAHPKVNPTLKNNGGSTALHYANDKTLPLLLKSGKFDPNARDGGQTPLHQAIYNRSATRVKILLAQPKINPNLKDDDGETPLDLALGKSVEISELLIQNRKVKVTKAQRAKLKFIKQNGTGESYG